MRSSNRAKKRSQRDKRERVPTPLTRTTFKKGIRALTARDRRLERIVKDIGPPPMWARKPGFSTLLYIILEQQVSLASAKAAYDRLLIAASPLTPKRFLGLSARSLRAIGFSRQKTEYGRALAKSIINRRLDLSALVGMPDTDAKRELMDHRGIGPWTADIYLLQALRRPDVWPSADLALAVAIEEVLGLAARPKTEEIDSIGECWRPWRAIAARVFWHYYLTGRSGSGEGAM
ncbi:MAG: DNA-3-methyladenine glycosylase 2 family protein [Candidatus Latescibacterota bacterium]|nr:MAG: DNA-3-methyladenine glycosylase 2 family protein [Candidatus Latescibacterota bacterium]